jgi:hypothetical protein
MDLLKYAFILLGVLFIIITFKIFIFGIYVFSWFIKILVFAIVISLILYLLSGKGDDL